MSSNNDEFLFVFFFKLSDPMRLSVKVLLSFARGAPNKKDQDCQNRTAGKDFFHVFYFYTNLKKSKKLLWWEKFLGFETKYPGNEFGFCA